MHIRRNDGLRKNDHIAIHAPLLTTCQGITHWAVTPLDLVKCRRQVDSKLYKGNFEAWRIINKAEGFRGVYTGGSPTFFGYSVCI